MSEITDGFLEAQLENVEGQLKDALEDAQDLALRLERKDAHVHELSRRLNEQTKLNNELQLALRAKEAG